MKNNTIKSNRDRRSVFFNCWKNIFFFLCVNLFSYNFTFAQDENPCSNCQLNVGATTESGYIRPELDKKILSPLIIPPDDTLVHPNFQQCQAAVALDTPLLAPASICNIPIKNITNNAPAYFQLGTTVVQWKFVNIYDRTATVNQNVIVVNNLQVNATVNSNVSTCGGSDGSAFVQVTGGTTPIQFLWSNNQSGSSAVNLQAGSYSVVATDANGCSETDSVQITEGVPEICNNGVDDNCNGSVDEGCSVTLNLKVLIEGFYLGGGTMNATIDPLAFPNVCDTITVELHNALYPYSLFVYDKKTIDITGNGQFTFPTSAFNQAYYIVIRHRNAIETWSNNPVLFNNPVTNYDFSVSANMAYGNNQSNFGDGKFGLYSGDISDASLGVGYQDKIIESSDYGDMENAVYFTLLGYKVEDITGDGIVESSDYGLMESNVYYTIVTIKP